MKRQAAQTDPNTQTIALQPLSRAELPMFAEMLRFRDWRADKPEPSDVPAAMAQDMFAVTQDKHSGCKIWLMMLGREIAGAIMMMPSFHIGCRQISYWLTPDYHGNGYATQAISALADQCFASDEIVRLQAQVLPENAASIRVLEKNGFTQEAMLPLSDLKDGEPANAYLYAKIKGEK